MQARTYTLAEARATLPQVKILMAKIQTARQVILRLRPTAWPALQKAASNGGSHAAGELALHAMALEEGSRLFWQWGFTLRIWTTASSIFWESATGMKYFFAGVMEKMTSIFGMMSMPVLPDANRLTGWSIKICCNLEEKRWRKLAV